MSEIIKTIEFNSIDNIKEIFGKYHETFAHDFQNKGKNFPKRLTMLNIKHCDYCQSDQCINHDKTTNSIELEYLYGIQLCDNCITKHSANYFKYIMEITCKYISILHFENIIRLFNNNIDFNNLYIKRTNNNIEQWKIDKYSMVCVNTIKKQLHIPVLNQDDTITKTVELSDFCNLNNIAYEDCLKLFTELYISMFKK